MTFSRAAFLAGLRDVAPMMLGVAAILLTTFIVELRMATYSASLVPWLRPLSTPTRSGLAYRMTDQAYAFSFPRFRR